MKRFTLALAAVLALASGMAYAAMNKIEPSNGRSAFQHDNRSYTITGGTTYRIGRNTIRARITDLSTATTHYLPVPQGGYITAFYCSVGHVITGMHSVISVGVPDANARAGNATVTPSAMTGAGHIVSATGLSQAVTANSHLAIWTDGNSDVTAETWCDIFVDPTP